MVPVSIKNLHLIDVELKKIKDKIIQSRIETIMFSKTSEYVTRSTDKTVNTNFLKSEEGTFSAWVRLKSVKDFYNNTMNNQYIFAHSTNYIAHATKGAYNYPNVFSVSLSPNIFDDTGRLPTEIKWRLWISNPESQDFQIISSKIQNEMAEWCHIFVRWNHNKPSIEFFINGNLVVKRDDYLKSWPKDFNEIAFIGTWGSRDQHFYVNAPLYRVITSSYFLDDEWLTAEQSKKPLG